MKVSKKQIAPLLAATFPEYNGRKFFVQAAERVTLWDLNWCEGSRTQYRTATTTGATINNKDTFNHVAPWANMAEGKEIPVPPGAIVASNTISQGRECGITFYIHPSDMPKLIN
jgi:hypothetical protein